MRPKIILNKINAGYPSSAYVLSPFDETEIAAALSVDRSHMWKFNVHLSSIHIASELPMDTSKVVFLSLKGMGEHKNIQTLYKAIEAMLVLYNIHIEWNDHPESILQCDPTDICPGWDGVEDEDDKDGEEENNAADGGIEAIMGETNIPMCKTVNYLQEEGQRKWQIIFDELFPA